MGIILYFPFINYFWILPPQLAGVRSIKEI